MSDDLIKRSDAIGACAYETIECYEARKAIRALPSVDRLSGKWVKRTHGTLIALVNFAYCSECGQPIMHEYTRSLWNFCPNCGARMKGADDE